MGRDLLQPHVCSTTSSLAGFCLLAPRLGAGGGGGGSEHAAVSHTPPPPPPPPARHRLSPASEQFSTTQGLMSRGRKLRFSSQVTQGISAGFQDLMSACRG